MAVAIFFYLGKDMNNFPKASASILKTKKRIIAILTVMALFLAFLLFNLLKLQIGLNSYYKDKVYSQVTTNTGLSANRGNIYDSGMNLLATTNTSWRIFVSPREIKAAEKKQKKNYTELISSGLSEILGIEYSSLKDKISKSNTLDITVKKLTNESDYVKVLNFIDKNNLDDLVFAEAQTSRFYPQGTLAAHVLGFTGSDNQGLYGLEYYYDSYLRGEAGYYLYAKDANGKALSSEYSSYIPSEAGSNLVTTIDSYVQAQLESQLEQIVINHNVTNRVTGIVMNTDTGAILAMATSSPFDPNSPYALDSLSQQKLDSSGYKKDSDEYKALKRSLLESMWSNKAVSETYEPGSTFKIITVAAAVDSGSAAFNDTFSCHGYLTVAGWRIKCHKVSGHGSGFTLSYGLQMSCNPTMMQISERTGVDTFYSYVERFGYFEKSGIDLPSEAQSIFHKLENMGTTELATASFGQRFKVTVINHLRAIASVANGGYLVTPHVVDKIVDNSGNILYEFEVETTRRTVSEKTAEEISAALEEGVSGNGGAKNAYVEGYLVAAKTGTSEKFDVLDENGNSYLRIGSTVAYSISSGEDIAVIIVVDEPQSQVKYGSIVAAPYISSLLNNVLPYLDFESAKSTTNVEVPNLVGMSTLSAKSELKTLGIRCEVVGNGELVLYQTPSKGNYIEYNDTVVYLYTEQIPDGVTVPNLCGKDISDASTICISLGLNVTITGSNGGNVVSQSLPPGAIVSKGEIIKLTVLITDYED